MKLRPIARERHHTRRPELSEGPWTPADRSRCRHRRPRIRPRRTGGRLVHVAVAETSARRSRPRQELNQLAANRRKRQVLRQRPLARPRGAVQAVRDIWGWLGQVRRPQLEPVPSDRIPALRWSRGVDDCQIRTITDGATTGSSSPRFSNSARTEIPTLSCSTGGCSTRSAKHGAPCRRSLLATGRRLAGL